MGDDAKLNSRSLWVTWTLRLLGILVPFFLTSFLLIFPVIDAVWTDDWMGPRMTAAAVLLLGFIAALVWRRDYRGAATIAAFYALFDARLWGFYF
jgi:hypothetical protein